MKEINYNKSTTIGINSFQELKGKVCIVGNFGKTCILQVIENLPMI
jgi:hypothetical protein